VTDADSEELTQLQYIIVGGNERGRFALNRTTGDITTAADIDREEEDSYSLVIEARDGLELFRASTGTAVIAVGDTNDQAPAFTARPAVAVQEELPAGTSVGPMWQLLLTCLRLCSACCRSWSFQPSTEMQAKMAVSSTASSLPFQLSTFPSTPPLERFPRPQNSIGKL
jgi:hypothetical protein